jgi:hypothetical protein
LNERLAKNENEMKRELKSIDLFNLSVDEYDTLMRRDESALSLKEFVIVSILL